MRLPRMTTRRWMIASTIVGAVFGLANWLVAGKLGPAEVLALAMIMLASFTIPLILSVVQFPVGDRSDRLRTDRRRAPRPPGEWPGP
jgi:hypothetical protein